MKSEFTQLLENVVCELRGMSYEDAIENEELLIELQDQVKNDLQNIDSTRCNN